MNLKLDRIALRPGYTIGRLYVDGNKICDTLEPTVRPPGVKIPERTAIPPGRYRVIVSFSPRFRRRLPLLLDVPGFSGIRIHRGNAPDDTAGCILPGENTAVGRVLNSARYEQKIIQIIDDAFPDDIFITIS